MSYIQTVYTDGVTPLNAQNLNKNEAELKRVSDATIDLSDAIVAVDDRVTNPVGEVARYNSAHFGKSQPPGGPNPNNVYIAGCLFMGEKGTFAEMTGPGSMGGNIYLPYGKALVGMSKDGPKTNPDGSRDSGARTIGFCAQVTDEDKENNEDSIYLGTDASRLYLYSATAYPVVVSKKKVIMDIEEEQGNPIQTQEVVIQSISPVATQEWVNDLLETLGLVGGGTDSDVYTAANVNPNVAFNLSQSLAWTSLSPTWTLNTDGSVSLAKVGNKATYPPLFQESISMWNEMYFKVTEQNAAKMNFILKEASSIFYGIEFGLNKYTIFAVDASGRRTGDFSYSLLKDLTNYITGYTLRFRYSESLKNFVFTAIEDASGMEIEILSVSDASLSSLPEFNLSNPRLGVTSSISAGLAQVIQLASKPANMIETFETKTLQEDMSGNIPFSGGLNERLMRIEKALGLI